MNRDGAEFPDQDPKVRGHRLFAEDTILSACENMQTLRITASELEEIVSHDEVFGKSDTTAKSRIERHLELANWLKKLLLAPPKDRSHEMSLNTTEAAPFGSKSTDGSAIPRTETGAPKTPTDRRKYIAVPAKQLEGGDIPKGVDPKRWCFKVNRKYLDSRILDRHGIAWTTIKVGFQFH